MPDYRLISSDNHVFEPGDLWTSRMEGELRGRAPHVERLEDGSDWWFCEGVAGVPASAGGQTGRRFEEPEKLTYSDTSEHIRPGGYIPEEHVKDMDIDGVYASLLYPTIGLLHFSLADSRLVTGIFRAYNDWLAEFCRPFPRRLKGIGMINLDDIAEGVQELERCAGIGLTGAMITVYPPEDRSYDLPEYDPFWAAAQDLSIPISMHLGTNRTGLGENSQRFDSLKPTYVASVDHWVRYSLGNMIFGGVFERYPKLQVGSVEMELGWVPHFLERIDYTYTQRVPGVGWRRFGEDMLPSEYFHRNVFLGFQEDTVGIRLRDLIGVDNILWGSDYPHVESTFPKSREILEEVLRDCTEEEKAKIAGGNGARIYRIS